MRCVPSLVALLSILAMACAGTGALDAKAIGDGAQVASPPATAVGESQQPAQERTGVLVPVEYAAISIWPEAWSGELVVLEVLPHGTTVRAGDVIARLDTRALEEQIVEAELEVRSAEVRHQGQIERNTIDDEAAAAAWGQALGRLERARRALDGWKTRELEFSRRGDDLQALGEQYWVEDQQDELAQLLKMYADDELVDATEEIVLKRSRRDLESTQIRNQLSRDRRRFHDELTEPLQSEEREEDVRIQEQALDRLKRSQAIEQRARVDAALRSAIELEKKRERLGRLARDLELLSLRAPREGVLLHGRLADLRPGGSPQRLERGSRLSTRTDIFLVADPAAMAVALELPETGRSRLETGARVSLRPFALPDRELSGTLAVDAWPDARAGGAEGGLFPARIDLEAGTPVAGDGLVFGMHVKVTLPSEKQVQG